MEDSGENDEKSEEDEKVEELKEEPVKGENEKTNFISSLFKTAKLWFFKGGKGENEVTISATEDTHDEKVDLKESIHDDNEKGDDQGQELDKEESLDIEEATGEGQELSEDQEQIPEVQVELSTLQRILMRSANFIAKMWQESAEMETELNLDDGQLVDDSTDTEDVTGIGDDNENAAMAEQGTQVEETELPTIQHEVDKTEDVQQPKNSTEAQPPIQDISKEEEVILVKRQEGSSYYKHASVQYADPTAFEAELERLWTRLVFAITGSALVGILAALSMEYLSDHQRKAE